jgi:hypothetical protein
MRGAAAFLESLDPREDLALSEFVLLELYVLLRNPAVLPRPLGAARATAVCTAFREHPRWQVVSLPVELLQQGVTHFATANIKDFSGFGFDKVWNPLVGDPSESG